MIRNIIKIAFILPLVILFGCKDKPLPMLPKASSKMLDPNGTFTLFVSNQSFAISPVDVSVEIDGELVISDYFAVGTQHSFRPFRLSLAKGKHKIKISSQQGKVELSTGFDLADQDVGVITFWYYPKSHYEPTPRHFDFEIQKGPLLID